MALCRHLIPPDLICELRRGRAKVGNKSEELKCLSLLERKSSIDGVYKNVLSSLLTMEMNEAAAQRKKAVPRNKRKRKDSSVGQRDGCGKARVSEKNKVSCVDNLLVPCKREKNEVREEDNVDVKPMVKKENEMRNQDSGSTNNCVRRNNCKDVGQVKLEKEVVHGDNGLASKDIKKEPEDFLESRLPIEGIYNEARNMKCGKCSNTFKKRDEDYVEGHSSSGTVPEVEILDSNMVLKKQIAGPFVSAHMLDRSMANAEAQRRAPLERATNEFREDLLKVLRKPYDKEEHQKSREAIRDGSYLIHHPDLHKKLKKYRYKREKCLVVLRGFLFWLQNLTREGAFKPWKDKQCLKVTLKH